jgi:hypothetical protein
VCVCVFFYLNNYNQREHGKQGVPSQCFISTFMTKEPCALVFFHCFILLWNFILNDVWKSILQQKSNFFLLFYIVLQAVVNFITMQFQLCTVFFTFSLGTRTHYFGRTILHGGARVCVLTLCLFLLHFFYNC